MRKRESILTNDEPAPYLVERRNATSDIILTVEHGDSLIPNRVKDLGLKQLDLLSHIALDLGIKEAASLISSSLDATLILQPYSRLLIDCNRPRNAPDLIVSESDGIQIPGNHDLSEEEITQRYTEIHTPFHREIEKIIELRLAENRRPLIVDLHSFTPVHSSGQKRRWPIGLLFNRNDRATRIVERILTEEEGLLVGINEPYIVDDQSDVTIPVHAESRNLDYLQVEIRQDLLATLQLQEYWSECLTKAIRVVIRELNEGGRDAVSGLSEKIL